MIFKYDCTVEEQNATFEFIAEKQRHIVSSLKQHHAKNSVELVEVEQKKTKESQGNIYMNDVIFVSF